MKLQQQLKSSTMSSKGGQQEMERSRKELEKTQCGPCLDQPLPAFDLPKCLVARCIS